MTRQDKLTELHSKIIKWAQSRDILDFVTKEKQLEKVKEELAELQQAFLIYKNDGKENSLKNVKDELGDVFVTLFILEEICKTNQYKSITSNYNAKQFFFEKESNILFNCYQKSLQLKWTNKTFKLTVHDLYNLLRYFADRLKLDFNECIEIAYNKISKRKGRIVNGKFVKEEDL